VRVIFIDWETTGIPDEDWTYFNGPQGIQLGLVAADTDDFEEIDRTSFMVRYSIDHDWSESAERIHGITRSRLVNEGLSWVEAMELFHDFASKNCGGSKLRFGGHNTSFDIGFVRQLFAKSRASGWTGPTYSIDHRVLDSMSLATIMGFSGSDDMFRYLGATRGRHDALEDAGLALKAFKFLFRETIGIRNRIATAVARSTVVIDTGDLVF
jgi:DNA polymerase III epsilon subunit-like protein